MDVGMWVLVCWFVGLESKGEVQLGIYLIWKYSISSVSGRYAGVVLDFQEDLQNPGTENHL